MDKLVSLRRGRTILYRSFVISLVSLIVGAGIIGLTARAANYTAIIPGAVNWTATNSSGGSAVWGCATIAPTDSCGIYPGQLTANPFVDNATMNLGSPLSLAVTTSIPAPFTLNMNGFGMSVDVATGGTMSLTGNSAVTSTGGTNTLSVSGGTLSVGTGANLGINGLSSGAQFVFNGGSITGGGNFTMSQQGFMSVTGTQGPMTTGNLLNITNNSTINYSATVNGWTLNGPLATTGTFNDNGSAPISGAGSINNTGVFQKSSGVPSLVSVPFNDSGTVSITSTSGPVSIDFAGGGNISGPFNLGVVAGSSLLFAGTAASPTNFNPGASFSGNGNVTFHGSRQNVNTTLSLPGNFTNNGNTFFGSGTPQTINVAGTFAQAAGGSIDARLFSATSFDKVAVTGTAGLSGIWNESVLYSPGNGDTMQPVTFSNNGGTTFSTVNAINPNGSFLVSYPPSTAAASAMQLAAVSQADIAVGKSGPASLPNGQNGTWNLSVKNNGPSAAGPVVLTESFTNALFVSSTPALCTGPAAGPLTCTIPTLGNGATQPIAIVLKANGVGTITNTFSVSSPTPADPNGLNDSITTNTTVTAASDLSLAISGPPTATASSTVTYTATVSNAGPDPVTPTVNLSVSTGTISGATGPGFTCSTTTTTASCTATGPMAAAGFGLITLTVVTPATPATLTVAGSATPTASDPNTANNNASFATAVGAASADISVVKTLTTATPIAGQNVQYNVVVTNNGPSTATNVQLTDSSSANLTFVSNTGACSTGFPCTIGPMANGAVVSFTSTFKLASNTGGATFTNSVTSTEPSDSNSANNTGTASGVAGASADVSIAKALTSTLTAGANATYSITVTNNGPSDAANVTVTDPTPAGMTFGSNSGACTTAFPCNIGTLVAGATATITSTYAVSPTATGAISNTATVSATTPDPNSGNNAATATGTIGTNSDLAITKSGPASANAGQSVTYTITVTNSGPSTATGVVVNDPTPAQTTAGVVSGPCSSFPCNIGTMAPGASTTISASYTINPGATGSVTNTATVSSTSTDPVAGNNTASKTTTVVSQADLQIIKTGPSGLPPGGGAITFNIVVKNLGPATATNIVVNDSPSAGLTFVSNSGACSTPFPCTIASLAAGAQATIQSTFNAAANLQRASNTADVTSSTTTDPNPSNNTSSVNLGSSCPSGSIVQFTPFSGQADAPVSGLVQWTTVANATYDVFLGPAGSGCTTLLASNVSGSSVAYSGLTPNTDYESRIVASRGSCPPISSQCIRWRTGAGPCSLAAPAIIAPVPGANVGSPVSLKWNAVAGADSYHVVVNNGSTIVVDTTTPNTSLDVTVPNGAITWTVTALSGQTCTSPASNGSFNVCAAPDAPLAGVVGAPTSGRTYSVIVVNPSPNNVRYEFQEADNSSFANPTTLTTASPTEAFTHTSSSAQVFFYRVRAFVACTDTPGPYSKTIRVVIVPPQVNRINVPAGSKELVVVQVQVPGEATPVNFTATATRPWVVKIDPSSGLLPAVQGVLLNVTIDPSQLPNGTFTSSIIIVTSPLTSSGRVASNGGNKSVPVTINLVTPVIPNNPSGPTAESLIIPAVGHLAGINSQWRSDIRIYNASPQTLSYLLNFTPQGSSDVKQTTITTASGDTTALDDIIHNWFGVGEVGDSSTGVLEIRPMLTDGTTTPPKGTTFTTVASSRTFSETSQGTVGQFIPPVKFTNFIGNGAKLSMQQLSQSNSYRTNFGLVEASGAPVSLVLSMFSSAGSKLFDLPVNLAGGEQKLLNGLLATQGVSNLTDGRMEVVVAGGNGKVTAYASVIDNQSSDPQLVPGQTIGGNSSRLYVVPGVADLNNGAAAWRTDMRVYNSGNTPQTANLTFFAQGNATSPSFATFTVNPGEVKVLDSVLQSTFSTHDVGGMVQVTTPTDSQLVVTARTFNQTSNGTLGQFIKAATTADGITTSTRGLNVLEVEDSPRFRTNLGLAEMSGRPATVEVSVILPDSKLTPTIQVPLAANEFRQFSVAQFGLGDIYNARVSVKVVDGQGSVTAYGSVIDQLTTDPTYVQAQ